MHQLVLNDVDNDHLPHQLAQMFIVAVYAQFEDFLVSFIEECPGADKWRKRSDGEPLVDYVLKNLGIQFSSECEIDRETVTYYRLVRNQFSHVEVREKRVSNQRKKLRALLNLEESDIGPPRDIDSVTYSDFDLFTRAVKSLGQRMCETARPPDSFIAALAVEGSYRALKKLAGSPLRYREALRNKLKMEFGLDSNESSAIISMVVGG